MTDTADAEVTQSTCRPYNAVHSFGFQLQNKYMKFPINFFFSS